MQDTYSEIVPADDRATLRGSVRVRAPGQPSNYDGHEALLFLSFAYDATQDEPEIARLIALQDVEPIVERVIDDLIGLGFSGVRFNVDGRRAD